MRLIVRKLYLVVMRENHMLLDQSVEVTLDLVSELVHMVHLVHQQIELVEDMLVVHQEMALDRHAHDFEVALVEETVEILEWVVLNLEQKDQKVVLDN